MFVVRSFSIWITSHQSFLIVLNHCIKVCYVWGLGVNLAVSDLQGRNVFELWCFLKSQAPSHSWWHPCLKRSGKVFKPETFYWCRYRIAHRQCAQSSWASKKQRSEDGDPYAVQTLLGWTINGPLGRPSQAILQIVSSLMPSSYVSVKWNSMISSSASRKKCCKTEYFAEYFDKDTIQRVRRNFYVDDCLKSAEDNQQASWLVNQLRQLLPKGGFHLTKWISNAYNVIQSVLVSERAGSIKELGNLPVERALEIQWDVHSDTLHFKIVVMDRPPTRRGIWALCNVSHYVTECVTLWHQQNHVIWESDLMRDMFLYCTFTVGRYIVWL